MKKGTKTREALRTGTKVVLTPFDTEGEMKHDNTSSKCFEIENLIGAGTTAIAYYAFDPVHQTNCILKECFPEKASLIREEQQLCLTGDGTVFEAAKCRFLDGYKLSLDLYYPKGYSIDFAVSAPIGFFTGNGTYYAAYMVREGVSYDKRKDRSLSEVIFVIKDLSEAIRCCHQRGYLYLDIREDNIFVLGCSTDQGAVRGIMLFDFDSFVKKSEVRERIINRTLRFSGLDLPAELNGTIRPEEIGIQTDLYQIAALLYRRLSGKTCFNGDVRLERTGLLSGCSNDFYRNIEAFLEKALVERRYTDDETFISDLSDLYATAFRMDYPGIDESHGIDHNLLRAFAEASCKYDAENKFKSLASLKVIYDNHIRMRTFDDADKNDDEAEDIAPYTVLSGNRLVFLVGDGGIGKSTLLQTYRQAKLKTYSAVEPIPFYIELHRYNYEKHNFTSNIDSVSRPHSDWIPFYLLCRLNGDEIPVEGSALYKKIQNQYNGLDSLFNRGYLLGFRYTILLDGFNEVSDHLKSTLLQEIEYYSEKWKGVQFVVTGRKIPEEYEKDQSESAFSVYYLMGLNREEIETAFRESAYSESAAEKALNDSMLMDVLRIPLFLNLFLGTDERYTKYIRTRGEILDAFVSSRKASFYNESIPSNQTADPDKSLKRKFLLEYLLPFVGSYADQKRGFVLTKKEIFDSLEKGHDALLSDDEVDISVVENSAYTSSDIEALSERILSPNTKGEHFSSSDVTYIVRNTAYLVGDTKTGYEFSHQYFRDYYAAKQIVNMLRLAQTMQKREPEGEMQLRFIHESCNLNYTWSDDVCILLGEIVGDYKNDPEYTEE